MAEITPIVINAITQQRHQTAAQWTAANPSLYEGEMGIETDTQKFKFGTGAAWNTTPYADSIPVSIGRAPAAADYNYKIGQLWLDTAASKLYWLKSVATNVATWVAVPNDAAITAMLGDYMPKSVFAKGGGAAAGKVDAALVADNATAANRATSAATADALTTARSISLSGDVTGTASFNGTANAAISVALSTITAAATVQGIPRITIDAKGRVSSMAQMTPEDGRTVLGLGSAALKTAGNAAGNVPVVGADGKLDTAIMPQLVITDVFDAASQAAMLALNAQQGDVCRRTDESKTYILAGTDPKVLANWKLWLTPECKVISVNGQTGIVSLTSANIAESGNLYWTQARFDDAFGMAFGIKSTDYLKEGLANRYYTDARVEAYLKSHSFIFNGNGA